MTCPCCGVPINAHVPLSAGVRAAPPPRPTPPLDVTRDILLSVEAQVERLRTKGAVGSLDALRDAWAAFMFERHTEPGSIESTAITLAATAVLWACRLRGAR